MYSALNAKGLVRRVGYLKTPFLSPISGCNNLRNASHMTSLSKLSFRISSLIDVTESNGEKVLIHNAEGDSFL